MNYYIIIAYIIYVPVTIALTIWVAHTIHKNTGPFLSEIFPGHQQIATSVNNLLQVGFYLIALGYAFKRLAIRYSKPWYNDTSEAINFMNSYKSMIEELASRLGGFTLFVGGLLFFNLLLMLILRKGGKKNQANSKEYEDYLRGLSK